MLERFLFFTSMLSSQSNPITGQPPHSFVLVSPCVNKYIYSHRRTREQEEEVSAERCGADEEGRRVDLYALIVNVKFGSGTQTFSQKPSFLPHKANKLPVPLLRGAFGHINRHRGAL